MATYVPAKINTSYIFYVGLTSQANGKILQVNPTLAAGDVKVATDDGAPGNLTTLPVVDADFTKRVKVNLSTAEMNGDNITIIFSDAVGDEWCDLIINIQTVIAQMDDIPNAAEIKAEVVDALDTDTYPEPGQVNPGVDISIQDKIAFMFKFTRNLITNDGDDIRVYNDAQTVVDQRAPVSEVAGLVSRGEFISGP